MRSPPASTALLVSTSARATMLWPLTLSYLPNNLQSSSGTPVGKGGWTNEICSFLTFPIYNKIEWMMNEPILNFPLPFSSFSFAVQSAWGLRLRHNLSFSPCEQKTFLILPDCYLQARKLTNANVLCKRPQRRNARFCGFLFGVGVGIAIFFFLDVRE